MSRLSLYNEIQILRKLDHPNIIKLHEVYETGNHIYMVQTYLKGGDLFDTILSKGSFSEKKAAEILYQILQALQYIHAKGIMHRDLKPENLMIKDKDMTIVLVDFGLAS